MKQPRRVAITGGAGHESLLSIQKARDLLGYSPKRSRRNAAGLQDTTKDAG